MRGACELGEEGHMKFGKACVRLVLLASATVLLCCGCGNSNGFIATTVSLASSVGNTLILGQSTTITATVTGPTDVNVKWIGPSNTTACQYTTTTVSTSGTSTTSSR